MRTILIVDDQVINRRILHRLLERDYDILEAENGQVALDLLRQHSNRISAVLLDIVMPVLDGYGVLSAMREDAELSKIPVIVSSQKDGDEAEETALELGAQDFIAKPYKANIIRHRLNNTIRLRETAAIINRVEKDELTGLLSKQFFFRRVADVLGENPEKEYDILSVGVIRFKLVNDTYGTGTGDSLLRHIAGVIKNSPKAVLSARFTADQFYVLIERPETYDEDLAQEYIRQIRAFPINMDIDVNCGVYQIKDIHTEISAMCDRAQLAAEVNKGRFNARYSFYDDSLRQRLLNEQFITSNMRTALAERQFHVYYQPKYDLGSDLIAGAEALVRWVHPTHGMLSPGEFIPLFEHNGFITQLDEYVWETACRDIREWMDQGNTPVSISVNVSRADVYNPQLTDILLGLLAKYQVPIRYLHLEITESAYTNNPDQIIKVVGNLRKLGFVIEMDDFGSGYSSLNMLAKMPVDILKLDMGFIRDETNNPSGKGILSFVISLAKWLNLAVVAEGVETAEQIATLRTMDCNYVQGYYYARPMKKEDFDKLLMESGLTEMVSSSQTVAPLAPVNVPAVQAASEQVMLIVDDIEVNRTVLRDTFEGWYQIQEAEHGKDAWDYLEENYRKVAIVLLDLLMPVMDGFQLLEKIRHDPRMSDLPVIITSQGDKNSEQRALNMQADDFISKPYNPELIQHRVRTIVESRYLHLLQREDRIFGGAGAPGIRNQEILADVMRPYFDMVRLVNPGQFVLCLNAPRPCYAVWGKGSPCANCTSMQALRDQGRSCKLEYSEAGLFFVISQYVPYGKTGAVLELVTKIPEDYAEFIFDLEELRMRLDEADAKLRCDPLTGAYNRRYLEQNLANYITLAVSGGQELSIALIDLDAFKQLNDSFGHKVGDDALKKVAGMLRNNAALGTGDFVARYGGDEFLVVCRDTPKEVFVRRIEAVAKLVAHIKTPEGEEIPIGISAGCVSIQEVPGCGIKELINRADRRLYKAKLMGSGLIVSED